SASAAVETKAAHRTAVSASLISTPPFGAWRRHYSRVSSRALCRRPAKTAARRSRPFHAREFAVHHGSFEWHALLPRPPVTRTRVRSLRHASSTHRPP